MSQEELENIIRIQHCKIVEILNCPMQVGDSAAMRHESIMFHVTPAREAFTALANVIGLEKAIDRWALILGEVYA